MKKYYPLIFALFFTIVQYGQELAAIDRANGPTPTAAGTVANVSAIGLTRTNVNQVGAITAAEFSSSGWDTAGMLNTNKHLQWSVKGNTGFSLMLTELNIQYQRSNQGPKTIAIYYSTDGFINSTLLRSDSYPNNDSALKTLTIPMTGIAVGSGATITFRLYAYDATNAGGQLDIIGNTNWAVGAVTNPGIRLRGSVTNSALTFNTGVWTPFAPNASTGNNAATVVSGTYTPAANIALNTLTVSPTGSVSIPAGITVTCPSNLFESNSTQYSSLILNGTITGTVNYSRHVNSGAVAGVGGNDLIAAPLSGQTFGLFATANSNIISDPNNVNRKLFGPFNKSTGTFQIYDTSVDGGVSLVPGIGYRAASTNNGNFTFTGAVNTGTVNQAILNSGPQFARWNLVGNPYPSYLYVKEETTGPNTHPGFLNLNLSQLNSAYAYIYGYDNDGSDGNTYTLWNLANTLPTTVITPGQGFFLAASPTGGTVSFTPGMRAIGNTDDFILGRSSEAPFTFLKLMLNNGTANYATEFYFNDASTLGLDPGYDAGIFGENTEAFSMYSRLVDNSSGIDIQLQSLPLSSLGSEVLIPIGIKSGQGQQLTVSISELSIPTGVDVYFEDTVMGVSTLLNSSNYVFNTTSNVAGVGRFYLRFINSTLSNTENILDDIKIISTQSPKTLIVKGQLQDNSVLDLYDIQGRLVISSVLNSSILENQVDVSNVKTGIYLVKLNTERSQMTKKIIIR